MSSVSTTHAHGQEASHAHTRPAPGTHGHDGPAHPALHGGPATPVTRLVALLAEDKSDLFALLVYVIVTGLLTLAVPLAVQSLVNIIASGVLLQPLVVLTCFVLGGLLLAGMLRLMQLSIVEMLQQRIFARVALELARRVPRIRSAALQNEYAPELLNRFFDVLTIQKTLSKLLLDGLAATLQAFVGLALMAFYHPLLLGFDLFVLLFMAFVFSVLGWGGLRTSVAESVQKYRVAGWLEEMGRCQAGFKMNANAPYLLARADQFVVGYLRARRAHFRVIVRQMAGNYLFQAVASAGLLALGGWLVIQKQLTLGQLVAAELIVASVLASLEKVVKQAEQAYDLLTGLEKVGHLTDLPTEREDGDELADTQAAVSVVCRNLGFGYRVGTPVLSGLNLELAPGARVSLVGKSGAGKTTLAGLLCGLEEPETGTVEIAGRDVRSLRLESLRHSVALVNDAEELFVGTLEENIVLGRPDVTPDKVAQALAWVQMTLETANLPQGLKTPLVSGGSNLSRGQRQRILLARALAAGPRLLILDEAFTGVDEETKLLILQAIYAPERPWTIINISHDAEVVQFSRDVFVLGKGRIVESGGTSELLLRPNSAFAALFPDLARQQRTR